MVFSNTKSACRDENTGDPVGTGEATNLPTLLWQSRQRLVHDEFCAFILAFVKCISRASTRMLLIVLMLELRIYISMRPRPIHGPVPRNIDENVLSIEDLKCNVKYVSASYAPPRGNPYSGLHA